METPFPPAKRELVLGPCPFSLNAAPTEITGSCWEAAGLGSSFSQATGSVEEQEWGEMKPEKVCVTQEQLGRIICHLCWVVSPQCCWSHQRHLLFIVGRGRNHLWSIAHRQASPWAPELPFLPILLNPSRQPHAMSQWDPTTANPLLIEWIFYLIKWQYWVIFHVMKYLHSSLLRHNRDYKRCQIVILNKFVYITTQITLTTV